MSPPILESLQFVVTFLLEAIVVGMLLAWGWLLIRLARGDSPFPANPILPPTLARWGIGTVVLVIIVQIGTAGVAGQVCRHLLGIDLKQIVAEKVEPLSKDADDANAEPEVAKATAPAPSPTTARQLMTWTACYNILFLASFPWIFRRISGAGLRDLGLSPHRWREQLRYGVVAGLIAAPLVYAIQFLAILVFEVNAHPVEQMLQDGFDPGLAVLALASTVVLAPLAEEILFRGVLQGWLTGACTKLADRRKPVGSSVEEGGLSDTPVDASARWGSDERGPAASEAVAGPICWAAVIPTSLVFAALHGPQWPAPIALFAFSTILGVVRQRTGSLLAPIAIHGLFNGCSTLVLLTRQLSRSLEPADADGVVAALARVWDLLAQIPI